LRKFYKEETRNYGGIAGHCCYNGSSPIRDPCRINALFFR